MKKFNLFLSLLLIVSHLVAAQTWDIIDKSMAAYNQNDGASNNQAWEVNQNGSAGSIATQHSGYLNFTKTNAGSTARWAWVRPALALDNLTTGTAYSIEVKVRVNPITIADEGSFIQANQIALRLGSKNTAAPIYLRYGDGVTSGSISTTSSGTNAYTVNTSEWQVYRIVFHADHAKYDVYIAGVENPIFENIGITTTGDQNGIYFGAESYHRCNMDIEYAKMGTGDFYSTSKIVSIALSSDSHVSNNENTITVAVNTTLIANGEKLLVSLLDQTNVNKVDPIEITVNGNNATGRLTIPSTVPKGTYFVKVTAPDGKIGDVNISPIQTAYNIYSSHFVGKNLVSFGNSITSAENSWAYQTYRKLGFADLYNGAVGGACWYKRARTAQDNSSITTQDYTDPNFAGMSNETNSSPEAFQRIINNCAVVHIQKYLIDKPTASPDYAVLSYGTNDAASSTMGSVEETMARSLDKVDLFTMAGALRWSIETLQTRFPAMLIYVALPIQAKDATKNTDNLKKIKVIKGICDALSISYFDCYNESTITVDNQATYLRDGLHPNEIGKVVHGDYIIKKLEEAAANLSAIEQEKVCEGTIAISTNVLNAGNHLSVKSLKNGSALEEMVLYNIVGNKVSHQSISDIEYTLQMPMVTGMYVLNVRLADKTSKGFKILVK